MIDPMIVVNFAQRYLGNDGIDYWIKEDKIDLLYCPICRGGEHGDKHSFVLYLDGGYKCMRGSCGVSGSLTDLAQRIGVPFGMPQYNVFSTPNKKKNYVLPNTPLLPRTEQINGYFEGRGISKATLDTFQISANGKGSIIFPFFRDKKLIYVKFRRPWDPRTKEEEDTKEIQAKNTEPILFGMDLCDTNQPLTITEGPIDCLSCYEAGIRNVVSVPSGTDNIEWIELCFDWLEKFPKVIVFGDNDVAGRRMIEVVTRRLDPSRCYVVEDYPDKPDGTPCKDANDILRYHGEMIVIAAHENAQPVPIKGLIDLADVDPIDPTEVPRIKTMIPSLDEVLGGLVEGAVTVISGDPASGKSTIGGQILLSAVEQGHNVCAYSGELRKERFQMWINQQAAGSPFITTKWDPVKSKLVPFVPFNIQKKIRERYRGHFFLFDNSEVFEHNQAKSIIDVFTIAVRRYGCTLFLADNLMTAISDSGDESPAQTAFVNEIKKFAMKFKIHVILVAHPRKKAAVRVEAPRGLDDVAGKGTTVAIADSVVFVEKPDLRIVKARDEGINKVIECCYCADSRRIYEKDKGDLFVFNWGATKEDIQSSPANSIPEYGIKMAEQKQLSMPF
jgi:twinkle protein